MKKVLIDFVNLFYPNLCLICGESLIRTENYICLSCLQSIPKTNYHLIVDNPVEKRFWGKVPIFRASSYYFFHKGSPFQKFLHELKYKGNKDIGKVLGKFAAIDLSESDDFNTVDYIVPVPLHPKKYAKRGYNQSEWICKGMAEIFQKPVIVNNLVRVQESSTQTKKSVFERYVNTEGIFELKHPDEFEGKHILVVDDVLTTGSTIEACIQALLVAKNIKVSVFTIALA